MSFIPSEALKELIDDIYLMSCRLVDGTYLIAEWIETEEENNIMHVASPVQVNFDEKTQKSFLRSWLDCEEDELVTIAGDKIIGFSETPFHLKLHYHRYLIFQKLQNVLTDSELEDVLKEILKPQVDNLDSSEDDEGEEWKAEEKSNSLEEFFDFKQPLSDVHTEWRKKFRDNN